MKTGKKYTLPQWVVDSIIILAEPLAFFAGIAEGRESQTIFGFVLISLWLMVKKFKNMLEDKPKEE
jgi:hypothetical protein